MSPVARKITGHPANAEISLAMVGVGHRHGGRLIDVK